MARRLQGNLDLVFMAFRVCLLFKLFCFLFRFFSCLYGKLIERENQCGFWREMGVWIWRVRLNILLVLWASTGCRDEYGPHFSFLKLSGQVIGSC